MFCFFNNCESYCVFFFYSKVKCVTRAEVKSRTDKMCIVYNTLVWFIAALQDTRILITVTVWAFSFLHWVTKEAVPESTSQHVSLSVYMTTHGEFWGLGWTSPVVSCQIYTDHTGQLKCLYVQLLQVASHPYLATELYRTYQNATGITQTAIVRGNWRSVVSFLWLTQLFSPPMTAGRL